LTETRMAVLLNIGGTEALKGVETEEGSPQKLQKKMEKPPQTDAQISTQ